MDSPQPPYDLLSDAPPPLSPEEQEICTRLLVQIKTFQILGTIFFFCGLGVFFVVFERRIAPDIAAAMRDISTAGLILAIFLPSILFFFMANRYEKQYVERLRGNGSPSK